MIKVSIKEKAISKGITTAYQLQKAVNVQATVAAKWYRNDLKMIGIESLDRLCQVLECTPNDLLVYQSGEPQTVEVAPKTESTKKPASSRKKTKTTS